MRKSTIFLMLFIFVATALQAQTSIKGNVINAGTGGPIPGVKVTLINQNISTQTDEQGNYVITFIATTYRGERESIIHIVRKNFF